MDAEPNVVQTPRYRVTHKLNAVNRVMRGEPMDDVADALGIEAELVEKWLKTFVSAGKNNLRFTCDPNEVPTLEALHLSAQKSFPTRLLNDCHSAASFFCAHFYGKNDTVHLWAMGVPDVVMVDINVAKLEAMRKMYPPEWEVVAGDAFAAARAFQAAGRTFDVVVCDTNTGMGPRVAFDEFNVFHSLCRKHLILMYNPTMFATLGVPPEAAPLSDALSQRLGREVLATDVIRRSSHAGGIYWCVFQATSAT